MLTLKPTDWPSSETISTGLLVAEVAELLRRAGEVDDDEDRRYSKDKCGDELPEELTFRESRLRKIRECQDGAGGRGPGRGEAG